MSVIDNVKQLLRHITTPQELEQVKKMVALLEMELKENDKR